MDINLNKKVWNKFSEEKMVEYVDAIFYHYRDKGFPYFPTDSKFRENEFRKLKNYDYFRVYDQRTESITQSMHGLSLAWSYMPHSWSVVCGNKKTPMQIFNDDILFRKVIEKRIKFGDNMSDNGIRKMLKIFTGTQSVSNFRPTAAAMIYSLHCKRGDRVWDMSSGFGGRLLGSTLTGIQYTGTDPSTKTHEGLIQLNSDFNIGADLYKIGSEDYIPDKNSLDFCFTSPPYFDWEKYSTEDTQSYINYPEKKAWLEGFLRQTIKNCYYGLKVGSYMAINIANTPSFKNFEEKTFQIAQQEGFKFCKVYKLALSSMKSSAKFKYEPIFLFIK